MNSEYGFLNHIGEVSYRYGKVLAERKDATDPSLVGNVDGEQSTQEFNVAFSLNSDAIIAEVVLVVESELFRIEVHVSGRWELLETVPEELEPKKEFAQSMALPRLVAVVETAATALAKQIDVLLPVFTIEVDKNLLEHSFRQGGQ